MKTLSLVVSRQQLVALASLLQRPEECAVVEFEDLGDGMIYPHRSRLFAAQLTDTVSWMMLPYRKAQPPTQPREAGFDFDGDPDPAPDASPRLALEALNIDPDGDAREAADRGESELTLESTRPALYVVTSRPGMTPFATVTSALAAEKESRKARALGLDGIVVPE